jgi:hypothetical protein
MRSAIHGPTQLDPLVLVLVVGCSSKPELGQVTGTVRAGGQPLANVLVTFVPQADGPAAGTRSMGTTDEQGRYQLRTERQEAGALVGQHKVIVEDLAIYQAPRSPDGTVLSIPRPRFAPAYSDPLHSPLTREVKLGHQTIDLDLEAAR